MSQPSRVSSRIKSNVIPLITPTPPLRTTKQDQLLELLRREGGATVEELATAAGWQPHAIRAFLSRVRRSSGSKFILSRARKSDGARYYFAHSAPAEGQRSSGGFCWQDVLAEQEGALAANTILAYRSRFTRFETWCAANHLPSLPSSPETLVRYLQQGCLELKVSTLSLNLSAISCMHRIMGHPDPKSAPKVQTAIRRIARAKGLQQRQAVGLRADVRDRMIKAAGHDLVSLRDCALLGVGYDTLCRRSELVSLRVEDVRVAEDGSGSVLVRRSKTDQSGLGRTAYLSPASIASLGEWLDAAELDQGYLFPKFRHGRLTRERLDGQSVSLVLKKLGAAAGLSSEMIAGLSGHSFRVGAALDMAENGIDMIPIMHSGGWKTPAMVARYTQQITTANTGIAKLDRLRRNLGSPTSDSSG